MATTVASFDTLLTKARSGALVTIEAHMNKLRVLEFGEVTIKVAKNGNRTLMIKGEKAINADFTLLRNSLKSLEKEVEKARSLGLVRAGRPAAIEENRLPKKANVKARESMARPWQKYKNADSNLPEQVVEVAHA